MTFEEHIEWHEEGGGVTAIAHEVLGPVVRMCDNPQCGSEDGPFGGCGRINPDAPMALSIPLSPDRDDDSVRARLSLELSLQYASDSGGMRRVIPDGCEFTAHKTPSQWMTAEVTENGLTAYTAVYSGPARDPDEALAGSPEYDWDTVHERYKQMQAARKSVGLPPA